MPFLSALGAACILDLLLGDPRWLPHPVRGIGWFAARMERFTRGLPLSERNSGRLAVHLVLLATGVLCAALLLALAQLGHSALWTGSAVLLYTTLAIRDLLSHAMQVHDALGVEIAAARHKVSLLVGRDTDSMNASAVVRACIESVAENLSDGIIAPFFWAVACATAALPAGGAWPVACGATAAILYKAISTMDSMFGYKNAKYLHFGCCAARLDDAANLFPARLSGIAIALAAPVCGGTIRTAWHILWRDKYQHSSPNSGWPEAAAAGALGLQLGGAAQYFGQVVEKPFLGEPHALPEQRHIVLACRLIAVASLIAFFFLGGVFSIVALVYSVV